MASPSTHPGSSPNSKATLPESKEANFTDPILRGQRQIAKLNKAQPYLLCLQDPANPLNDLGAKAFAIKHIQAVFRRAKSNLEKQIQAFEASPPSRARKDRWRRMALLDTLVGGLSVVQVAEGGSREVGTASLK
jgi:hypothetical protein